MKKRPNILFIIEILSAVIFVLLIALFLLIIFEDTLDKTVYVIFLGINVLTFFLIFFYFVFYFEKNKKITRTILSRFPDVEESFHFNVNGGFMIYDERERIVFLSKWLYEQGFKIFLGKNINLFYAQQESSKEEETIFHFKNSIYSLKRDHQNSMLIFKDETEIALSTQIIKNRNLSLILIDKHFSNKVSDKVKINLNINEYLAKWVEKYNGILKTESTYDNLILLLIKWNKIDTNILEKGLMDKIKEIIGNNKQNISISIGLSYGNLELSDLYKNAREAIENAKNRGGNQIVISDEKGKITFLGESSLKDQENSKIELKFFNDNLINSLKEFNRVFITAHNMADIDAVAGAIGISKFVKQYNSNVNIILFEFDNSTLKIYKNLSNELKSLFLHPRDAKDKVTKKTGIIIVDTAETIRTQGYDVVKEIEVENRIVIDHHRIGGSKIETRKENSYIDTAASSVSEIVTELFTFKKEKDFERLSKEEASLLILGIYLDTNNLKRNTSPRTFEVLTYLSNEGGDITNLIDYTKSDFLNTPLIVSALEYADRIRDDIIFSYIPESQLIDESTLSFLANMLLDYEGIKASFILAKVNKNTYKMSARSNSEINVQYICEKLGGGGHFNIAAASFNKNDNKFRNLRKKIRDVIIESISIDKEQNGK